MNVAWLHGSRSRPTPPCLSTPAHHPNAHVRSHRQKQGARSSHRLFAFALQAATKHESARAMRERESCASTDGEGARKLAACGDTRIGATSSASSSLSDSDGVSNVPDGAVATPATYPVSSWAEAVCPQDEAPGALSADSTACGSVGVAIGVADEPKPCLWVDADATKETPMPAGANSAASPHAFPSRPLGEIEWSARALARACAEVREARLRWCHRCVRWLPAGCGRATARFVVCVRGGSSAAARKSVLGGRRTRCVFPAAKPPAIVFAEPDADVLSHSSTVKGDPPRTTDAGAH